MAIEIVDSPIKNGDFPVRYVSLPEGIHIIHVHSISQGPNWDDSWDPMGLFEHYPYMA